MILFSNQIPGIHEEFAPPELPWYHCRGDLSFATNANVRTVETIQDWANSEYMYSPPRTYLDLEGFSSDKDHEGDGIGHENQEVLRKEEEACGAQAVPGCVGACDYAA